MDVITDVESFLQVVALVIDVAVDHRQAIDRESRVLHCPMGDRLRQSDW
jgi:hypothetical protein